MGREEDEPETMEDVMGHAIRNGARDYWETNVTAFFKYRQ
jgi:hypothetical protein